MSFAPWNPEPRREPRNRSGREMRNAPSRNTIRQQVRPSQQQPIHTRPKQQSQQKKPYILYYSSNCKHSQNFLLTVKRKNVVGKFSFLNINKVSIPKYITTVPTVILVREKRKIEGMEALDWIGFEERENERITAPEGDRSGSHSRQSKSLQVSNNNGPWTPGYNEGFLPGFANESDSLSDSYTEIIGDNNNDSISYDNGTKRTSDDLFYTNQARITTSSFSPLDAVDKFRINAPEEGVVNPNDIEGIMARMERERDINEKMRSARI